MESRIIQVFTSGSLDANVLLECHLEIVETRQKKSILIPV
jgi:hypothetical protein